MDRRYYVYILQCKDGSYYTGVTNNIERRMWEHETGYNSRCYTFDKRPVKLKYCEETNDIRQAVEWEKQLKGWSRKKKEALFKEDWDEVKRLAKCKKPSTILRRAQDDRGCDPSTSSG